MYQLGNAIIVIRPSGKVQYMYEVDGQTLVYDRADEIREAERGDFIDLMSEHGLRINDGDYVVTVEPVTELALALDAEKKHRLTCRQQGLLDGYRDSSITAYDGEDAVPNPPEYPGDILEWMGYWNGWLLARTQ